MTNECYYQNSYYYAKLTVTLRAMSVTYVYLTTCVHLTVAVVY